MGTIFTPPTPGAAHGTICKAGERVFAINATRDDADTQTVRWLYLFVGTYGAGGVQLTAGGIALMPGQNIFYPLAGGGLVLRDDLTYRVCESATDPRTPSGTVTCNAQISEAERGYSPPLGGRDSAPYELWSIRNTL